MIKVVQTSDPLDDTRRLIHSVNYSEVIRVVSVVDKEEVFGLAPGVVYGGLAVDRSVFRMLQPDARWLVYGAGWVNPTDGANGVTITIQYETDAPGTVVVLGTLAVPAGVAYVKRALGPFDIFNTATVPQGETIPIITLKATKLTAGTGELRDWCLWFRFLAPKQ